VSLSNKVVSALYRRCSDDWAVNFFSRLLTSLSAQETEYSWFTKPKALQHIRNSGADVILGESFTAANRSLLVMCLNCTRYLITVN